MKKLIENLNGCYINNGNARFIDHEEAEKLLENFKKEILLEFLYWWMPDIHSQDAHSQIRKFENYLLIKQK